MYSNVEIPRRDFGDSLQLTNWTLYSGVMCHMTPDISDFVPGSLLEMYKYIEVADENCVTEKNMGQVQIIMHNNNVKPFIATLYNVLFSPDLCD